METLSRSGHLLGCEHYDLSNRPHMLALVPMAIALFISSSLWLKIDPAKALVPEAVEPVHA